jgi:hypothetical protein
MIKKQSVSKLIEYVNVPIIGPIINGFLDAGISRFEIREN